MILRLSTPKKRIFSVLKLVEEELHMGSVVIADNAGVFAYQMGNYLDYVRNSGKYRSR